MDSNVETRVQLRTQHYQRAKAELNNGNFVGCISILLDTQKKYGSHVSIWADLATCYYFLGDMFNFRSALQSLRQEFEIVGNFLGEGSFFKTATILGKFKEELGEVGEAKKYYQLALEKGKSVFLKDVALALAQLLRVEAEFKEFDNWSIYYFDLVTILQQSQKYNFNMEILHALFLAEARRWNVHYAIKNMEKRIQFEDLGEQDQQLLFQEILLQAVIQNTKLSVAWEKALKAIRSMDVSGQIVKALYFNDSELLIESLNNRHQLSAGDRLRLLPWILKGSMPGIERNILKDELQLSMEGLTRDSQVLWKKNMQGKGRQGNIELIVDEKNKVVVHRGEKLLLKNRSSALSICLHLAQQSKWETDEFINKLWGINDPDESYFHRLRMQVKRLNESLFDLADSSECIVLNSRYISLAAGVNIFGEQS